MVNQTTGCIMWGGMQAGFDDPNGDEVVAKFQENSAKVCKLNATFLLEPDLSPQYSHVPPHLRAN